MKYIAPSGIAAASLAVAAILGFSGIAFAAPVAPFTDGFDCIYSGLDVRYDYTGEYAAGTLGVDTSYYSGNSGIIAQFDEGTQGYDIIAAGVYPCDSNPADWSAVSAGAFSFGKYGSATTTMNYNFVGTASSTSADGALVALSTAYALFLASMFGIMWVIRKR